MLRNRAQRLPSPCSVLTVMLLAPRASDCEVHQPSRRGFGVLRQVLVLHLVSDSSNGLLAFGMYTARGLVFHGGWWHRSARVQSPLVQFVEGARRRVECPHLRRRLQPGRLHCALLVVIRVSVWLRTSCVVEDVPYFRSQSPWRYKSMRCKRG